MSHQATNPRGYETHTCKHGDILEVEMFPHWSIKGRGKKRGQATKPSRLVQKKLNYKNAKRHLERLLNLNFVKGRDIFLTLTHTDENAPQTEKEAKKALENYLRRLKHFIKRSGDLPPLKYIAVTEWKKSSTGYMKPHYHVALNMTDRDVIERLWGNGRTNARILQADPDGGLQGMASYFIGADYEEKDQARAKNQRRYQHSNNLTQPMISVAQKKVSARKAADFARNEQIAVDFFERAHPEYTYIKMEKVFTDFVGGVYLYVRMRKKTDKRRKIHV